MENQVLTLSVNGTERDVLVEPRQLLSEVLREELNLKGTKRGCDTAKCGACTVLLDGEPVKSCNLLALQADGADVTTIEGLADGADGDLTPVQEAFWRDLSFQCGFCTPGLLMTATRLLEEHPDPTEEQIRDYISGNICRCTGYVNIVEGIQDAARMQRAADGEEAE